MLTARSARGMQEIVRMTQSKVQGMPRGDAVSQDDINVARIARYYLGRIGHM